MNWETLPPLNIRSFFIPLPGWENYEQSKYLKEWSKSDLENLEYKTGIKLDEGTKGFPLELLIYMFRKMGKDEYARNQYHFLDTFFETSIKQKGMIAAKNCSKSLAQELFKCFIHVNFDFAYTFSLTKYNNATPKILDEFKDMLEIVKKTTGIDFSKYFELPEKLNERSADIYVDRIWRNPKSKKIMFKTKMRYASFDKPNKLTGTKAPGKFYILVSVHEPVMFNDPNDITAKQISDNWANSKNSIFRGADKAGFYRQMITDMNNWDPNHDWIITAEHILPYDLERAKKEVVYSEINKQLDWMVVRITRFSNQAVPFYPGTPSYEDAEINKERNYKYYLAETFGAPYTDGKEIYFTYRPNLKIVNYGKIPFNEIAKNPKRFNITFGIDFGINDASVLSVSIIDKYEVVEYRDLIANIDNKERKKQEVEPLNSIQILNILFNSLVQEAAKYIDSNVDKLITYLDDNMGTNLHLLINAAKEEEIDKVLYFAKQPKHNTNSIKNRILYDNFMHSTGRIIYTKRSNPMIEQYYNTRNKKNDPEKREEKNQPLDMIDSINSAGTDNRIIAISYLRKAGVMFNLMLPSDNKISKIGIQSN